MIDRSHFLNGPAQGAVSLRGSHRAEKNEMRPTQHPAVGEYGNTYEAVVHAVDYLRIQTSGLIVSQHT